MDQSFPQPTPVAKKYEPPRMLEYGTVQDITRGGGHNNHLTDSTSPNNTL